MKSNLPRYSEDPDREMLERLLGLDPGIFDRVEKFNKWSTSLMASKDTLTEEQRKDLLNQLHSI